jgi:hypothetical protein
MCKSDEAFAICAEVGATKKPIPVMYSSQSVVPILNKGGTVVGMWATNPGLNIDRVSLAELRAHAEPMLKTFTHPGVRLRRVPNTSLTVIGNSQFPGGVFIMMNDELAPNEAMRRGLSEFGLLDMGGGILFLHATREFNGRCSTAEGGGGAFLALTCGTCTKVYSVGVDALVMTMEMAAETMRSQGVTVLGSSPEGVEDDLVDTAAGISPERLPNILTAARDAAQFIKRSRRSGQRRRWICRACKAVNEYPPCEPGRE